MSLPGVILEKTEIGHTEKTVDTVGKTTDIVEKIADTVGTEGKSHLIAEERIEVTVTAERRGIEVTEILELLVMSTESQEAEKMTDIRSVTEMRTDTGRRGTEATEISIIAERSLLLVEEGI